MVKNLGEVNIRRGIFQGALLFVFTLTPLSTPLSMVLRKVSAGYGMSKGRCKINHLHFMDYLKLFSKNEREIQSLVQTMRIVSDDIGMKYGSDKCAVLIMKRGRGVESDGIDQPDELQLRALGDGSTLLYLSPMVFSTRNSRRNFLVSVRGGSRSV